MGTDATQNKHCSRCGVGLVESGSDSDPCGWCVSASERGMVHCQRCGNQVRADIDGLPVLHECYVPAAHNGIEGELLSEGISPTAPPTHPVIDELIVASEKYLTTSQRVDAQHLRDAIDAARKTYGG